MTFQEGLCIKTKGNASHLGNREWTGSSHRVSEGPGKEVVSRIRYLVLMADSHSIPSLIYSEGGRWRLQNEGSVQLTKQIFCNSSLGRRLSIASLSLDLSFLICKLGEFRLDYNPVILTTDSILKTLPGEESRWRRNRMGDHFLFYKFIERTIERWRKFAKQLLIASRGHQAPRKAAHCLRREVGQKY